MKTGMFIKENSDAVYVGLKNEFTTNGVNRSDAVINWSDDVNLGGGGPDNLRFIFTASSSGLGTCINCPTTPTEFNGVEIARMTPDGKMGIGPNYTTFLPPARRLEVHDNVTGNSQLRLTFNQQVANFLGTFTDFRTTVAGDMEVDPRQVVGGVFNPRTFFINNNTGPNNIISLDVNGQERLRTVNPNNTLTEFLVWDPGNQIIQRRNIATLGGFGQACGQIGNPGQLTQNTEVPTNAFNFVFTNNLAQPGNVNNVGIGLLNGNCNPTARLEVYQQSTSTATIAVDARNEDLSNGLNNPSIGVRARLLNNVADQDKVAGWFEARTLASMNAKAIIVPPNGGNVGIGTVNPTQGFLLEVIGNALINNTVVPSDSVYKINVQPIGNALQKIRKLNGVYFNYDSVAWPTKNFSTRKQMGMIAQQVQKVVPEVVYKDINGFYSMDYEKIVALLAQGMKQLDSLGTAKDSVINNLASRLTTLETIVNNCCSNSFNLNGPHGSNERTSKVELKNTDDVVLYQNEPNPFREQTTIRYYLTENCTQAQVVFYDEFGRLVKSVELNDKGAGKLDIDTRDLSTGIYSYSIVVNGMVKDTKRMIRNK